MLRRDDIPFELIEQVEKDLDGKRLTFPDENASPETLRKIERIKERNRKSLEGKYCRKCENQEDLMPMLELDFKTVKAYICNKCYEEVVSASG